MMLVCRPGHWQACSPLLQCLKVWRQTTRIRARSHRRVRMRGHRFWLERCPSVASRPSEIFRLASNAFLLEPLHRLVAQFFSASGILDGFEIPTPDQCAAPQALPRSTNRTGLRRRRMQGTPPARHRLHARCARRQQGLICQVGDCEMDFGRIRNPEPALRLRKHRAMPGCHPCKRAREPESQTG